MPETSNHIFAIYHLHYKKKLEMTKSTYSPSLLRSLLKLISLLGILSDCVVKFATHHSHYKDIVNNPTRTFACVTNYPSFLCGWSNLLAAIFAYNSDACTTKPGLSMKKGEPPKTSLYLLSHQLPSLFLSLTLSKMCPAMFKYSLMSKCSTMSKYATIFKWQLSSTLASFPL